jgi:alpha-ketoglutarate-dependent taurine dioxygenase
MPYVSTMISDLKFSDKEFPTIIVNDGTITSLAQAQAWVESNLNSLAKELNCTGAILFRGFPITDAQSYDAFFSSFDYANFTYDESLSNAVRINHTEYVFTANEAPKEVEIYLHNEMAQTPIYPSRISLFCEKAAAVGGETAICSSASLYSALLAAEPTLMNKLEQTGVKYTTSMPAENCSVSGQGRSWRGTLSVDTVEQAEEKLQKLGYSWQWAEDGSLKAQTAVLPAIRELGDGRKVFFNQIIASYMGWKGVKESPETALCFGDDSSLSKNFLDTIVALAESITFDVPWQDGDVALLDNNLSMHGRRPYSGDRKRKVLVILGKTNTK